MYKMQNSVQPSSAKCYVVVAICNQTVLYEGPSFDKAHAILDSHSSKCRDEECPRIGEFGSPQKWYACLPADLSRGVEIYGFSSLDDAAYLTPAGGALKLIRDAVICRGLTQTKCSA